MFDELRNTPTFEEYVEMCRGDVEPPTRAEYDAFINSPPIGEIGVWRGISVVTDKRIPR
jgi:hypothetical protein